MASAHGARFAALYEDAPKAAPFSPDAASAGRRALRNACLRYLTSADDEDGGRRSPTRITARRQHDRHDRGARRAGRMDSPRRDAAFADFHDRFGNPLVLDKWMGLQAGSPRPDTVARVRALMSHPAFDIKNPNRVRALVGAFSGNHLRFHAARRRGYALVGEIIAALDEINPRSPRAWRRLRDLAALRCAQPGADEGANSKRSRSMPGLSAPTCSRSRASARRRESPRRAPRPSPPRVRIF